MVNDLKFGTIQKRRENAALQAAVAFVDALLNSANPTECDRQKKSHPNGLREVASNDTDSDMEAVLENELKSQEKVLHRFTVEDFQLMDRAGVFPPDSRVELLEGKIYEMRPIGPFHAGVCGLLAVYFVKASNGRWIVRVQTSIQLASDSQPQPDLVLARPAPHRYKMRHPSPEDIFLVIEVAQSSLLHDSGYKRPLYARAGITEVWIVDLNDEVLRTFRKPDGEIYTETQELRAGQFATLEMFSDVKVDLAELFKRVV